MPNYMLLFYATEAADAAEKIGSATLDGELQNNTLGFRVVRR